MKNKNLIQFPILLLVLSLLISCATEEATNNSQEKTNDSNILPLRERAIIIEDWLDLKKKLFIPELLQENEVDMWVITVNDRSLYPVLVPANNEGLVTREPYFLVYVNTGEEVNEIHIGNMNNEIEWGPLYPDQSFLFEGSVEKLRSLIKEVEPQNIAFGIENNPDLLKALSSYKSRFKSHEDIRNRWIEYRSPEQIEAYKTLIEITRGILKEAFSNKVITPDVTTTSDVDWWVKQRVTDLGLKDVFGPTVMVWRSMGENKKYGDPETDFRIDVPPYCGNNNVIRRGDLLSCDFGIQYLGISSDIQQVGYVLKDGETEAPAGLIEALRRGNRLQEILADEFVENRTGNEILFAALKKAKAEELRPEIYCHPMGSYVRRYDMKGGALPKEDVDFGPSIGSEGRFDESGNQLPSGHGQIKLRHNTAYAMELDITHSIPEWGGQDLRLVLEEKVVFTKDGLIFPGGKQTEFYLIK
jgi:hypothetical protein